MDEFKRKFVQNFIDDHRYRYLFDGLKVTLQIAICAVILGVILGFFVAIIRSTHDKTGKLKFLNSPDEKYLSHCTFCKTVIYYPVAKG